MHFSGNTTSLGLVLLIVTSAWALPENMEPQGANIIKCRLRVLNQNQYGNSNSGTSSSPGQIASKQYGMPQESYLNCGSDRCDVVHKSESSGTPCSTSVERSIVQTKTPESSTSIVTSSQSVETPNSATSLPPSSLSTLTTSCVSTNTPEITTSVPPSPYEPPKQSPSPTPTPHEPPHKPQNPPPPPLKEPPTKPPSHPAPSPLPSPTPKQPPSPPTGTPPTLTTHKTPHKYPHKTPPPKEPPTKAPSPPAPNPPPSPSPMQTSPSFKPQSPLSAPRPQYPVQVPAPIPQPPPVAEEPPMDNGSSCSASPLVFDVNYDWRVQVKFGTGIWLDPSNVTELHAGADGGDVMLAMPDMNGNGQIDIEEVFGNRTLSPFTNVSYKAANGFEALHKLAIEADAQPLCTEKSANPKDKSVLVSLPKLKACLQKYGHDLGFISGDNVKVLQPLNQVDTVDVVDYVETPDDCKGGMKHAQKGHYYDKSGHEWRVDDVWFMTGTPYSKGLI
ncbi:hypothetical protein MP228_006560 [Amoeboaphelidium protococcarum]|nr:hypothetical protein MP228_006560 [Amoeboaphelidium protococcarum]